ncbi:MAG: hypothetical protein HY901_17510, partial [Deltaproteobacteria bacterium]|nr:hypothetical protein [Deltaproteobacteria bacterium]
MIRSSIARFSLVLFAALGCAPDLSVPEGARIHCRSDSDCPGGYTCSTALSLCLSAAGRETVAPVATGALSSSVLAAGSTLSLEVTASEPLALAPQVSLGLTPPVELTLQSADGLVYRFAYSVRGNEPEEEVTLRATLVDLSGNQGTTPLDPVRFDFTPPDLSTIEPLSPALLGRGGKLSVRVTVNEALKQPPVATLGLSGPALALEESANQVYRFGLTPDPAAQLPEGAVDLVLTATDAAGNTGTHTRRALFTLDFTPPTATLRFSPEPGARRADELAVWLDASEPLLQAPALTVRGPGELLLTAVPGSAYRWRHVVTASDADGDYAVAIAADALRDLAGNQAEAGVQVTIPVDASLPLLTALDTDRAK